VRVIGGSAKGRRLKNPPPGVRPTSDLVRGAIFDALEAQGANFYRVLDLYAGTGALGIEALSRGAEWCDFVEQSADAAATIRENLRMTGLGERARVLRVAVESASDRIDGPYSLVLADPPYNDDTSLVALEHIARSSAVSEDATVVLEGSSRSKAPEALDDFRSVWNRRYGDSQVTIYRRE
jgi:16S rRNA (guanine966-N2)-methyltransferase